MRKCSNKRCGKEFDELLFPRNDGKFYKMCYDCRQKANKKNIERTNKKIEKIGIEAYKEENKQKQLNYRKNNKNKIKDFEKRPSRKKKNLLWWEKTKENNPHLSIYYSARRRSKINNIICSITPEDVLQKYPKDGNCPILGMKLIINNKHAGDNSPTLDRIIPSLGYVPDNIIIISYRANRIKNNALIEDLEKIINFYESKK